MIPRAAAALRRAARMIAERPRATAWTVLAATCALVAVGAAALVVEDLDASAEARRGGTASMVVYLGDGVDDARAVALAAQLRAMPGVEHVEVVAAAESARRLERALGPDSALLDGVDVASLPASVEVSLAAGMRDVIVMSATVRALRGTAGVDDVIVEDGGATQADRARQVVRAIAWTGAFVLGALALAIVLASIRVRFDDTRAELAVAHLLGASPAFAIVPAAIAGALHGLAAAALAAFVLWLGFAFYGDAIASGLGDALGAPAVSPTAGAVAMFLAVGAALGTFAGALAGGARALR